MVMDTRSADRDDLMKSTAAYAPTEESTPTEVPEPDVTHDQLITTGVLLIILGVISFWTGGMLAPLRGPHSLLLGFLTLMFRWPGMFILNGIALVLMGIIYFLTMGSFGSLLIGLVYLYFGILEIRKFPG